MSDPHNQIHFPSSEQLERIEHMDLTPVPLEHTEQDFDLFAAGLLYVDMRKPGTLYRVGKTPNIDEIRQTFMDPEVAAYAYINDDNLAVCGGMLHRLRNGQGYISSVYCVPELEHMGFGRGVIAALLQRALAQGMEAVSLDVYQENERAQSIYQYAGFVASRPLRASRRVAMTLHSKEAIEQAILALAR